MVKRNYLENLRKIKIRIRKKKTSQEPILHKKGKKENVLSAEQPTIQNVHVTI